MKVSTIDLWTQDKLQTLQEDKKLLESEWDRLRSDGCGTFAETFKACARCPKARFMADTEEDGRILFVAVYCMPMQSLLLGRTGFFPLVCGLAIEDEEAAF